MKKTLLFYVVYFYICDNFFNDNNIFDVLHVATVACHNLNTPFTSTLSLLHRIHDINLQHVQKITVILAVSVYRDKSSHGIN